MSTVQKKPSILVLDFGTAHTIAGALDTTTFELHLLSSQNQQTGLLDSVLYLDKNLNLSFSEKDAVYRFANLKRQFIKNTPYHVRTSLKKLKLLDEDAAKRQFVADLNSLKASFNADLKTILHYDFIDGVYDLQLVKTFSADELLVLFLQNIVKLFLKEQGLWISSVVYSYPVYLDLNLKHRLKEIFNEAGLQPIYNLSEPEAVVLNNYEALKIGQRVLVVDSGAGTTDVCLLMRTKSGLLVEDYAGDNECGGLDIDNEISAFWLRKYHQLPEKYWDVILNAKIFLNEPKNTEKTFVYGNFELTYAEYLACANKFLTQYENLITPFLNFAPSFVILSGGSNLNLSVQEFYTNLNFKIMTDQIYMAVINGLKKAYFLRVNERVILEHATVLALTYEYSNNVGTIIAEDTILPASTHETFNNVESDFKLYLGFTAYDLKALDIEDSEYSVLPVAVLPKSLFADEKTLYLDAKIDNEMTINLNFATETKQFKPVVIENFNAEHFKFINLQLRKEFILSFKPGGTNYLRAQYAQLNKRLNKLLENAKIAEKTLDATNFEHLSTITSLTAKTENNNLYQRLNSFETRYENLSEKLAETSNLAEKVNLLSDFLNDAGRDLEITLTKFQQFAVILHLDNKESLK